MKNKMIEGNLASMVELARANRFRVEEAIQKALFP
jgi:hypothetical protein